MHVFEPSSEDVVVRLVHESRVDLTKKVQIPPIVTFATIDALASALLAHTSAGEKT
jgi:hypothetical protein